MSGVIGDKRIGEALVREEGRCYIAEDQRQDCDPRYLRWPLETGKGRETDSPLGHPGGMPACHTYFSPVKLILDV